MKNSSIKYLLQLGALLLSLHAGAQKAWLEPGGTDFNPEDSVRIYVNLAEMDNQTLVGFQGDLYIWTWLPTENVGPYKQGTWNSSNEELKLTPTADPNVYYFAMIPTVFYAVTPDVIYEEGFAFLIKAKDGSDQGNGDMKTEDIMLKPEKPGVPKVFTMPAVPPSLKKSVDTAPDTLPVTEDDFITIFYNNKLEELPAMQNLTAGDEIHIFIRTTGSDNKTYTSVRKAQLGLETASKMRWVGDGLFAATFNLGRMWRNSGITASFTQPPADARPLKIEVQFAKVDATQPNIDLAPKANGIFIYYVGRCQ